MQEVQTILPNGSIVRDRYVVEELLGKGGFGAVYLVRDLRVKGNRFALKEVADPKKQDRQRLTFEGEVLRRLDHYALPRVYRVFEDDQQLRVYLLMDYIEGPNLETLRQLQPEKRFTLPSTMHLMAPIVEAVTYLHDQQPPILHRDIKPSNIIVPPAGENAVLVDFGIAKEYHEDSTTTTIRRLSPNYSAPEQYARGTNTRTDVYGLGATFYTLLTGTVPLDALSRMTHMGSQGIDPLERVNALVPAIPASVSDAICRAMAININERFATVQEFWQALQPSLLQPSSPEPIIPLPETQDVASPELLAPPPETHHSITSEPITPLPETQDVASPSAPAETPPSPTVSIYRQDQERPSRRRRVLPLFFVCIALIALLFGVLLGTGRIFTSRQSGSSAPPATSTTRRTTPSTPASSPTHPVPTATAPASPTSPPAPTYPALKSAYSGTIHDASANIDGTLTLTNIQEKGSTISGYLTQANGLYGNANFSGTISTDKTFRFIAAPYTQYLPLLFQGKINADGSLTGNYCSERNNQCDYQSGGFGSWKASPSSPTANTPAP